MSENTDITDRLGRRLKDTRSSRGLSLDAVSKLSGVSRSMVSQIERGESSPTVATLWNLTRALGVDFAGLVDDANEASQIEVVRADEAPMINQRGEGCLIRILSPPQDAGRIEVYELIFEAGGKLDSMPHAPGTTEAVTVISGRISISSGETVTEIGEGDTARYAADLPHQIRASADHPARAFLLVFGI